MGEKFSLKWNDFHSVVSTSFAALRNEEYLHDVTLVTDDQYEVSAHKLVLSACSQFFKNIFKNNRHNHPLLCLDGISSQQLSMIMEYVYNGEVQIFQEDLDKFLLIAQRFKIEGLLGNDDTAPDSGRHNPKVEDVMLSNSKVLNDFNVKETTATVKESHVTREDKIIVPALSASQDIEQINEDIKKYVERLSDGHFKCVLCGKTSNQKSHIRTHIETHLEGLEFQCQICGKTFRSRNSLRFHKSKYHK